MWTLKSGLAARQSCWSPRRRLPGPAPRSPSCRAARTPISSAWEQAGKDAMKDFNLGAGDYRVPQKWELAQQSQLLESLLTQGYNSFLIFPGDAVGTNATVSRRSLTTAARPSPPPAA